VWSKDWLVKFHPEKCVVMTVGKKGNLNTAERKYEMSTESGRCALKRTVTEKDIGVMIEPNLKFQIHISNAVSKANRIVGVIRRTYSYLDEESFLKLYKALVRPHLEYANCVWHPWLKKDIDLVEGVQRRATKLIPTLKELDYASRLRKLNLPTMSYRRARGDMIEVYKLISSGYDSELAGLLVPALHSRTRGHSRKLYPPKCRTSLRKIFFTVRVVGVWNGLPERVVNAPNLFAFERRLDDLWKNQPIKFEYRGDLFLRSDERGAVGACPNEEELDKEATACVQNIT
jgi:hypothetical protein